MAVQVEKIETIKIEEPKKYEEVIVASCKDSIIIKLSCKDCSQ